MDKPFDAENFLEEAKIKQHNKLTAVGFTDDQADILLAMMQEKAMLGGMF